MDGLDLYREMQDVQEAVDALFGVLDGLDADEPLAEMEYQVRKREVEMELRERYGATVARDTVRGVPEVAELRLRRDTVRNDRQSARERLWTYRQRLAILKDMAAREWTREER